jgi:hypothetical protein
MRPARLSMAKLYGYGDGGDYYYDDPSAIIVGPF